MAETKPKQTKKVNTDLKFSEIKKLSKQVHIKEKYELDNGSTITHYVTFPPTQIDNLIKEMQSIYQTKDEQIELSDDMQIKYIQFLCIKYFSHLKTQLKAQTFVGQLDEMQAIADTEVVVNGETVDLFSLFIDDIFSPKEVQKVFDKMAKFTGSFLFLERMNKKMQDEFNKLDLKNRDIFENLSLTKNENNVVQ